MLSVARMAVLHEVQCEAGKTTDSFLGRRDMQTLAKLPTTRPSTNPIDANTGSESVVKITINLSSSILK